MKLEKFFEIPPEEKEDLEDERNFEEMLEKFQKGNLPEILKIPHLPFHHSDFCEALIKGELTNKIIYHQELLEILSHPYLKKLNYIERNKKIIKFFQEIIFQREKGKESKNFKKIAPVLSGIIKEVFVKKALKKGNFEVILPFPEEDANRKIDLILKSGDKFINLQVKSIEIEVLNEILFGKMKKKIKERLEAFKGKSKKKEKLRIFNELKKDKEFIKEVCKEFIFPFKTLKELRTNKKLQRFYENYIQETFKEKKGERISFKDWIEKIIPPTFLKNSKKLEESSKKNGGMLIFVPFVFPSLEKLFNSWDLEEDLKKIKNNKNLHLDLTGEPLWPIAEIFEEQLRESAKTLLENKK